MCQGTQGISSRAVAGRFFDGRVFDVLEVGVTEFRSLKDFGAAAAEVQVGNKVRPIRMLK